MGVFELIEKVRDRFGLSLTAFPQGMRFIAAMMWACGATAIILMVARLVGLEDYIDWCGLLSLLGTALFMNSALTKSYDLDAAFLAQQAHDEYQEVTDDDLEDE